MLYGKYGIEKNGQQVIIAQGKTNSYISSWDPFLSAIFSI